MRRVLDAHTLELELARVLGEPAHVRPPLTLVVLRVEGRGRGHADGATPGRDLLGSLASIAAERLRRGDTVGLLDDDTVAVLLAGATPAAAESVARDLEELLRPRLSGDADDPQAWMAHGLSGATDDLDCAGLILAARVDLQRRVERRTELTPL